MNACPPLRWAFTESRLHADLFARTKTGGPARAGPCLFHAGASAHCPCAIHLEHQYAARKRFGPAAWSATGSLPGVLGQSLGRELFDDHAGWQDADRDLRGRRAAAKHDVFIEHPNQHRTGLPPVDGPRRHAAATLSAASLNVTSVSTADARVRGLGGTGFKSRARR